MTDKTQTTKSERPRVHISALTANTCEVTIFTEQGEARFVCSHDAIEIDAKGISIQVRP